MDPLIELPALSQKHAARYAPYRTPRRARSTSYKSYKSYNGPLSLPGFTSRGLFDLDPLLPLPSRVHPPRSASVPGGFGERREALGLQRRVWALACLKFPASRTDNDKMNL